MNVLGWTQEAGPLPAGVSQHRYNAGVILLASPDVSDGARDRLALQVKCFDSGIGFIPASPHIKLTVHDALTLAKKPGFLDQLGGLQDNGQFTLALHCPTQTKRSASHGRNWLIERKALHDTQSNSVAFTTDLVEQTGLKATPLRSRGDMVECDLLANRNAANEIRQSIQRIIADASFGANATLVVTGLWPPFGFVQLPASAQVAA